MLGVRREVGVDLAFMGGSQGERDGTTVTSTEGITKIDAASAQIASAVRIYFLNDSPISVYALAAAAREILTTIGEKKGIRTVLRGLAEDTGQDFNKVVAKAAEYAGFFKHADRRPDAVLTEFSDTDARLVLFIAAHDLSRVAGGMPQAAQVYEAWWYVTQIEKVTKLPLRRQQFIRDVIRFFPRGFRSLTLSEQKAGGLELLDRYGADESLRMDMNCEFAKVGTTVAMK